MIVRIRNLLVAFVIGATWEAAGMWLILYSVWEVGELAPGLTLLVGFAVAMPVVGLVGEAHFNQKAVR